MSTHHPPTYPRMPVLTFTTEPDEFLGLNALIALDGADGGGDTGSALVSKARALMRGALADKLQEIGLPWAPSAAAVKKRAAEAAEPTSGLRALIGNKKVRKYGTSVVAVAALVVLWGGYHLGMVLDGFPEEQSTVGLAQRSCWYRSPSARSRCGSRTGTTSAGLGGSPTEWSSWPGPGS